MPKQCNSTLFYQPTLNIIQSESNIALNTIKDYVNLDQMYYNLPNALFKDGTQDKQLV